MHQLSLRFHLERRTGGLSRIIERGSNGIETIVRFTILNTVPTIVEFALIVAVLLYQFDWRYVLVIVVTVAFYMVHLRGDRLAHRHPPRDERERPDAHSKAIDSLLNFETVKYFGNEEREASATTARWRATRAPRPGLDVARLAQYRPGVIFTIGMTVHGDVGARHAPASRRSATSS